MKLLLSTSNLMPTGSSVIHRPSNAKTNTEIVSSLRSNFEDHASIPNTNGNGNGNGTNGASKQHYKSWTRLQKDILEIPALDLTTTALQEEREAYDITLKLFYLPSATSPSAATREAQTREALNYVLQTLHMPSLDLLIVSFPGIYFDEEEDCPDKISTRGPASGPPEDLETQIETWKVLEKLYDEGLVKKLGVSEFGHERLQSFLESDKVVVKPAVDQINLRDCCSVPKDLMKLAKQKGVELLVHNDCSNILPRGTVRELLGPSGAGVLAEPTKTGDKRKSLHGEDVKNGNGQTEDSLRGELQPKWVVKYTAVVRDRGVVEDKGYFALAELAE
ncbi:hypothetical protein LTR10_009471 [Elasticomyces elasticus]|nr:hypothetical protein LTR10_009471 [Elasticomyces elasticus]KAK4971431.1 hypothetical protein LTR42_007159 [Elasticomyces elasticus]